MNPEQLERIEKPCESMAEIITESLNITEVRSEE